MSVLSPPVAIHCLVRFPAGFLGLFVLAAIPRLFSLRQRDFNLGDAVAEVDPQRNDGQSLGLNAARQFIDFAPVQKQFAAAKRLMIPWPSGQVLRDMRVHQKRAAGFEVHVRIANVSLTLTKRLHFRAVQYQARLVFLQQMIIVRGRTILRDNHLFGAFRVLGLHRSYSWLGHNLSFYLMPRLIETSGQHLLQHLAGNPVVNEPANPTWPSKRKALAHGTVCPA
jgi:hypothetical protein